ncbi:MAG TPA: hypothetical protein VL574_03050 [Stellaceae bacterium]|nr:hypothetical protein [Stellaceae bacterium]
MQRFPYISKYAARWVARLTLGLLCLLPFQPARAADGVVEVATPVMPITDKPVPVEDLAGQAARGTPPGLPVLQEKPKPTIRLWDEVSISHALPNQGTINSTTMTVH